MNGWRRTVPVACCAALIAVLLALTGCRNGTGPEADGRVELLVSAAVSLQRSMDRIAEAYEQAHPGIRVTMNYGASGALRRQIEQGAPADLYISADIAQMDELVAAGLIVEPVELLGNRLTVVVPADLDRVPSGLDDLATGEYLIISIGDPAVVPAGVYADEALRNAGILERIEPRLVYGQDVRQVLAHVESGNADAGFVYRTDALRSDGVREAFTLPDGLHAPIRYPAGIVKGTKHPDEAGRFLAFLTGDKARRVFEADGFDFLHAPGRDTRDQSRS